MNESGERTLQSLREVIVAVLITVALRSAALSVPEQWKGGSPAEVRQIQLIFSASNAATAEISWIESVTNWNFRRLDPLEVNSVNRCLTNLSTVNAASGERIDRTMAVIGVQTPIGIGGHMNLQISDGDAVYFRRRDGNLLRFDCLGFSSLASSFMRKLGAKTTNVYIPPLPPFPPDSRGQGAGTDRAGGKAGGRRGGEGGVRP